MEYLDNLEKNKSEELFFCQVGAMDGIKFDGLHKYIKKYSWSGILFEPVNDMFLKLKDNYKNHKNKLIFENLAISNKNGEDLINRVPLDKIPNKYYLGMSTLSNNYKHLKEKNSDGTPLFIKEKIKISKFKPIVDKYDITKIDILQIDTEGYDLIVFNEIFSLFKPSFICIEHHHLTNNDRKILEESLKNYYKNVLNTPHPKTGICYEFIAY